MSPRHTPWADAPPDFSIGLRPIGEGAWLEGGDADAGRKMRLLAEHPQKVWGERLGSQCAQSDVLRLVEAASSVASVGAELSRGFGGGGPNRQDLAGDVERAELPDLWRASLLVADDLCLMEKRDGHWRLTAASLCSPTFFTVEEALGRSLAELHGPVPDYDHRFLARVERIFNRLAAGQILERRNWTLVNSADLFLPSSAPVKALIAGIDPAAAGETLFLRVERQTLRKISEDAAVFTIRIWRDALAGLRTRPELIEAFARAWRAAPEAFRAYKGLERYDPLVESFLKA